MLRTVLPKPQIPNRLHLRFFFETPWAHFWTRAKPPVLQPQFAPMEHHAGPVSTIKFAES
ncbi:hypothetical protein M2175_006931 [Bradyrhizobium elkanii]|nr:hypothetical protein [Bradyrhizobium elkanii]MCS3972458.1 hypothetical protein [Bradyrhizobium japonicum]